MRVEQNDFRNDVANVLACQIEQIAMTQTQHMLGKAVAVFVASAMIALARSRHDVAGFAQAIDHIAGRNESITLRTRAMGAAGEDRRRSFFELGLAEGGIVHHFLLSDSDYSPTSA